MAEAVDQADTEVATLACLELIAEWMQKRHGHE